jgi:negative regulator of sigma E activity
MNDETSLQKLVRWAKTPPQVYVIYLVTLIVVWLVTYYAGTLNRRNQSPAPPTTVSAPRS